MTLLQTLHALDVQILAWVQQHLQAPWLDSLMAGLSNLRLFLPLLVVIFMTLVWMGGSDGRRAGLWSLVLVLLTDQLSSSVLKPLVARARPSGGGFSFPSSHATNIFGQAVFFSRFYPRLTLPLIVIATSVGFSRIYLGKHYPSDVLAGAALGTICALSLSALLQRKKRKTDEGRGRSETRLHGEET